MGLSHRRIGRFSALAMAAVAVCNTATAQDTDGFTLRASHAQRYDDNLFRLSDDVDPQAVLGRSSGADTIGITSVGVNYAHDISLQRVELDVSLVDYRYRTFDYLDQQATNYGITWRWAFTPRLRGTLSAARDETVNSFDDVDALTSNRRVRRTEGFDARYELDGAWRLVGGVRSTRDVSDQPVIGEDSFKSRSADVGLRYDARSGSSVTARLRNGRGSTVDGVGVSSALSDPDYRQRDLALDVRWLATGKLAADFNLVRFDRTYAAQPTRDYSGTNTAVALNWAATAKTQWSLQWSSDLTSYQTTSASSSRNRRLTASGAWQVAARTRLQASLSESRRSFQGSVSGSAANTQRDTTRDASLSLTWNATRNMALNASLQRTQRSSNQPGVGFSSTQAVVGITLFANP